MTVEFKTLKAAKETISLTNGNTKMPGSAFSSDSFACKVGSRLASIKGSVCESCYARRIQKLRPSVNQGWTNNYEKSVALIANAPHKWVAACVFQINRFAIKTNEKYHRWFDSGDLDSLDQLKAIIEVAKKTPDIKHWLPTRELAIVRSYNGILPSNLVVRLSAPMVDDRPIKGANTSTVHKHKEPVGHICPAPTQKNNCGSCRACWSPDVANVSYHKH
tara:strand:+ start:3176 stop:3832 length:657 start_codon:yes stop_codon:yes gene_type:complete